MVAKKISILGIRGIPARHGGFETFAECLSLYLIEKGWEVTVYCQEDVGNTITESSWNSIRRVHIPVRQSGALGTMVFDAKAIKHALGEKRLFLTLGYNTAIFNVVQRVRGQINIINMDGIEWRRHKWGAVAKIWFWLNERVGCWIGNHLVADHPKIADHLATRVSRKKITMIPYGGDEVVEADVSSLRNFGVEPDGYSVIIARPEPENSILQMVRAFSSKKRGHTLVVLGNFSPDENAYHKQVMDSASSEVKFVGAIYDSVQVRALRFFCRYYLHGHQVGGTNPSLVEGLAAQCAVIAHDNHFNRWVAGQGASYFSDESDCSLLFDRILNDTAAVSDMKSASYQRYISLFTWQHVLGEYEALLSHWQTKVKA